MILTRDTYEQTRLLAQDGECTPEQRAALQETEDNHPEWKEDMGGLERFQHELHAHMEPPTTPEFSLEMILQEAKRSRRHRRFPLGLAAAAALALLLGTIPLLIPHDHAPATTEFVATTPPPVDLLPNDDPMLDRLEALETELLLLADSATFFSSTLSGTDELENWASELLLETTI